MTTPLIVAPNVTSYASRTPYLTAEEYSQAPTAVDVSNVVQGGSDAQNKAQTLTLISRASSMADEYVFGQQGCLAATRDIDGPKHCLVQAGGLIKFKPRYHPVLEVDQILIGSTPSQLTAFPLAAAINLAILQTGIVEIPIWGVGSGVISNGRLGGGIRVGSRPLVQMSYVNGYANTTLKVTPSAGDSTITPTSVIGFYPGAIYTIYDTNTGNENVIVGASYVTGSAVVPLAAPLVFSHAAGISISALPGTVKQAVTLIMSALVKTRGSLAIVRGKLQASPTKVTKTDTGVVDYLDQAMDLLRPFQRVALT